MTETETAAAPIKAGTPNLNKALSLLQGELPKIKKTKTAEVKDQQGNRVLYKYDYADLGDVVADVGPLLAKHGLAFHCAPTINPADRREMILIWSLLHESGEERSGEWPLGPVNQKPQSLGSAITYGRRYSFTAATNIVLEDDDDGQRAQQDHGHRQSAGDIFEKSTPARQNGGNGHQRGQVSRPAQPQARAQGKPADAGTGEADPDAQAYAEEAYQALTLATLEDIQRRARDAGKLTALVLNPSSSASGQPGKLAVYLDWKRKQIKELDDAIADLTAAASETGFPVEEIETHVKSVTGTDLDAANVAQIRHATQVLRTMQGAAA